MKHLSYDEVARSRAMADQAMTRRTALKGAGAVALTGAVGSLLAACGGGSSGGGAAASGGGTVKEIGLSLTEDPRILGAAKKELGINVQGKSNNLGNQITFWNQNAKQFDINQVNFNQLTAIERNSQPVKTSEVPAWDVHVPALFREPGQPGYNKRSGWPLAGIYTETALKSKSYDELRGVPTWFGADAFGYLSDKAKGDLTSYGAIFDPANKGRATLLNEPITSIMKVATYLEGSKQASFKGAINNLTKSDLDTVFAFLGEQKAKGQFRLFWSDFGQLVDLLAAGEIWVGDFWASAVTAAQGEGAKAVFVQEPKEGSNAWIQGAVLSKYTKNRAAALKYINWNLDGGDYGATLSTQGYYSPRPDVVKTVLAEQKAPAGSADAYAYFYEGADKARPSLEHRLANVADWQAYPDEFEEYSRRWTQFISA